MPECVSHDDHTHASHGGAGGRSAPHWSLWSSQVWAVLDWNTASLEDSTPRVAAFVASICLERFSVGIELGFPKGFGKAELVGRFGSFWKRQKRSTRGATRHEAA